MTDRSDVPLLEIDRLSVSYFTRSGNIPAVIDFSLSLAAGESVGLVGESGCGKSTVAMAIMQYLGRNGGIVGGEIRFRGRNLAGLRAEELRRVRGAEIAMVYQEPMTALNPSLTIATQLKEVPLVHDSVTAAEAEARAMALLADVSLSDPERIMAAYPHQLSGGQQQRVVIAMALASNPSLLLLDEPTTALDVTIEAGIVRLIADLRRRHGTALLYISHNLGLIREVCDRVTVMYSGEAVEHGDVEQTFATPRHPYTRGLFDCIPLPTMDKRARPLAPISGQLPLPQERPAGCNFGPRCDHFRAGQCDSGEVPLEAIAETRSEQAVRCLRWRDIDGDSVVKPVAATTALAAGDEILSVRGMQKYYALHDRSLGALVSGKSVRYIRANEMLDFTARQRETVAIVGESGCGKSTFAKVMMGLETATGGEVRFDGQEIGRTSVQDRTTEQRRALQMVFQNPDDTLNPSLTVGAQIARVIRKFAIATGKGEVADHVNRLLDLVKLPRDFARRRPRQLSGGQKQRIGIARAFAGNPALVVADEPLSALDVSVQAAVTELLTDIQREHGTTLLFISHDLSVVRYLADRVVVMYLGQIMETGTTDEVFGPPYHPYTEALLAAVPVADPRIAKRRIVLEGSLPSALDPPSGCPFHTRCPHKIGIQCEQDAPPRQETGDGHYIACHIPLSELKAAAPVFELAT